MGTPIHTPGAFFYPAIIAQNTWTDGAHSLLAKYSLIMTSGHRCDDGGHADRFGAVRTINSDTKIITYMTTNIYDDEDTYNAEVADGARRWATAPTHRSGPPNTEFSVDHQSWFYKDPLDNNIQVYAYSHAWYPDVSIAAMRTWQADAWENDKNNYTPYFDPANVVGVFMDNCFFTHEAPPAFSVDRVSPGSVRSPAKYLTGTEAEGREAWNDDRVAYINAMSTLFGAMSPAYKVFPNSGETRRAETAAQQCHARIDLDNNTIGFFEESFVCVKYGVSNGIQFFPTIHIRRTLDTITALQNIGAWCNSSVALSAGASGTDNYGDSVSYYDGLWFSLGCYKLCARHNQPCYHSYMTSYQTWVWHDEYDDIDLGAPVADYTEPETGWGMREFTDGYVIVNFGNAATPITRNLPETCMNITRSNMSKSHAQMISDAEPQITSLQLARHRAAFLWKVTTSDPPPPTSGLYTRPTTAPASAQLDIFGEVDSTSGNHTTNASAAQLYLANRGLDTATVTVAGTPVVLAARQANNVSVSGAQTVAWSSGSGVVEIAELG